MDPLEGLGTVGQGGQGGAATPPSAPATPPAQPAVGSGAGGQSTQPASLPAGGTQPGATSLPGTIPQQAAQDPTVRDVLAQYGYDVRGQFQNDHSALQHLVQVVRQAQEQQQYLPYAQQYMQHASQFQQYLAQQQAAQAAQQSQQQQWFNAPEFDPAWQQKIYRDQQGNLQVMPGNDPMLIHKYLQWQEHQQKFLNNFSKDPIGSIKPGIEQIVQQIAGQMVQQQLARVQEQAQAQTFIERNSEWLHQRDAGGNLAVDPRTGRPALSSLGRQFAQYVFEAESFGLRDTNSQQRYAMGLLQRDFLMSQAAGGQQQGAAQVPAQAPGQGVKDAFLQRAAGQVPQQAAAPPGNTNGNYQAPAGITVRGLQEMMAKEFAAAGIVPGTQLVG